MKIAMFITSQDPNSNFSKLVAQKLLKKLVSGDAANKDTIDGETVHAKVIPGRIAVIPWDGKDTNVAMELISKMASEHGGEIGVIGFDRAFGEQSRVLHHRICNEWVYGPINYAHVTVHQQKDKDSKQVTPKEGAFFFSMYFAEEETGDVNVDKLEYLASDKPASPPASFA